MAGTGAGKEAAVEQPSSAPSPTTDPDAGRAAGPAAGEPTVDSALDGGTARLALTGELTDAARRPLVRVLTDLLLAEHGLERVELALHEVSFVNSAGLAVLVQLHKLVAPRGVGLVLVGPPPAVVRSLQLTGLWHRFTVEDAAR